jgi:glycosyltransferase involved in cell wall biosynthesis
MSLVAAKVSTETLESSAPSVRELPVRPVTIVIPFLNEADSLVQLVDEVRSVMDGLGAPHEILLVDDGSTDDGPNIVRSMCTAHPQVRLVRFNRNFGKAAALSAGFAHARGEVIITMDADLQDDPKEIPRFLNEIEAGYGIVSGWKKKRHDPLDKTFPSRIFNWIVRKTFSLELHDINCGFKAYTRDAAMSLRLYGELHRFTPALLHGAGFPVKELVVEHRPRQFGKSKYGFSRFLKGLFDLMTVLLLTRYSTRPLHFFGSVAIVLGLLGLMILSYLTVLWFMGLGPIGNRPLLFLGILLIVTATQLISLGLVAELIQTSQLSEDRKYVIKERVGFPRSEVA